MGASETKVEGDIEVNEENRNIKKWARFCMHFQLSFDILGFATMLFTIGVWSLLYDKVSTGDMTTPGGIGFPMGTNLERDDRRLFYATIPQFFSFFVILASFFFRISAETFWAWETTKKVYSARIFLIVLLIMEVILFFGLSANVISSAVFMWTQCEEFESCDIFPANRVARAAFATGIVMTILVVAAFIFGVCVWVQLGKLKPLTPEQQKLKDQQKLLMDQQLLASGAYVDPIRQQIAQQLHQNQIKNNQFNPQGFFQTAQGFIQSQANKYTGVGPGPPPPGPNGPPPPGPSCSSLKAYEDTGADAFNVDITN